VVAERLFPLEERQAIAAAVAEAERATSGEIVPVVASSSDGYERAEDLLGGAVALCAFAALWTFGQGLVPGADWDEGQQLALSLPALLGVLVVGWIAGVLLARGVPPLKRLFVPRRVAKARVLVAAHQAFETLHVRRTAGGTGVVLYVSLFEREVCVCADRAIAAKVEPAEWEKACSRLVEGLRAGAPAAGFVAAIRHVGSVLAAHFPIQPGDRDELTNELHVLE
jgi:putative membrane protein